MDAITELRLNKMEEKFEKLKEEVAELRTEFKVHMTKMEELAGDNRSIIAEIRPVIEDFNYNKAKEERIRNSIKDWSSRFGLLTAVAGVVTVIYKAIQTYFGKP